MSGKITNNNGDLSKAFFGNAEVEKIYLGNTELYSKAAPVGYVIPAGTYYGKASPDVSFGRDFSLPFTAGGSSWDVISIGFNWQSAISSNVIYYYANGFGNEYRSYRNSVWVDSYRTIRVTTDTTVTQDEYNAFFACFDYAFTVRVHTTGNVYTYGFANNMTWNEFVNSSYNDGEFSVSYNDVNYGAFSLLSLSGMYIHGNDSIIHSYKYMASGGGN